MDNDDKYILLLLGGVTALWAVCSFIWEMPHESLLMLIFGLLTLTYCAILCVDIDHAGQMVVTEKEDGGISYSLELTEDPVDFATRKSISFKVVHAFAFNQEEPELSQEEPAPPSMMPPPPQFMKPPEDS